MFEPLDFDIEDEEPELEDTRHAEELGADLARALDKLSDIERVCFVLKHLEEWRLKEIAEETGSNVGTVKQALFRGVRKLRGSMPALRSVTT